VKHVAAALAPITPFPAIDFVAMAHNQGQCPSVQSAKSSTVLQLWQVEIQGAQLWCDVALGTPSPLVDRQGVFRALHGVAHPRIRATRRLISARFVWHGLASDVGCWCRDCQTCQRGKVTKQPAAPLQEFPIPAERFSHVHVDLVGPLPPSSEGHMYLLTVIDRTTSGWRQFRSRIWRPQPAMNTSWLDG
jgi:hypothetical protein